MIQSERRLSVRKPLERLAYISLPFNNGGIVLDVSEGGLGFHAIAPVEANGPIQFRFAVDSSKRIKAVGELAWKDETGKTGGLRFTELPDEIREYIREWAGQTKTNLLDVPAAAAAPPAETAQSSEAAPGEAIELAPAADIAETEYAADAEYAEGEQAADAEASPGDSIGWTPSWDIPDVAPEPDPTTIPAGAEGQPLLYNLRPPVYSSPSYNLSMFSPEAEVQATAALAAQRGPFASRHPIAALVLTIFLASVVSTGIFAYVSTSQAGDILYYLGEKAWEGIHPQPAPKSTVTPPASVQDASQTSPR